jgi:membrane protease YdiL (CAAX protease family)
MFVLIKKGVETKKAIIIQSIIFGLAHFGSLEFWDVFDIISVIFLGLIFTYSANKTGSLITPMIFHFIHDAFIFLVQVPDGLYIGTAEHIAFYLGLWPMICVGFLLVKIFNIKNKSLIKDLY